MKLYLVICLMKGHKNLRSTSRMSDNCNFYYLCFKNILGKYLESKFCLKYANI